MVKVIKKVYDDRANEYKFEAVNGGVTSINGQTGDVTIQNENNVKVFETTNNVVIQGGDFTNDATLVAQIQEMVEWLTEDSNHAACIVYKENSGSSVDAVTLYVYEAENATMGATDKLLEFYYMSQDGNAIYYQYGHIDIISGAVSSASISNRNVVANKFSPLNSGTTGQVLTKTSSGYNWQDASGGLQVAPNSPITGIKYVWYGTEADYANLSQYYTDTPGDTEFRCF